MRLYRKVFTFDPYLYKRDEKLPADPAGFHPFRLIHFPDVIFWMVDGGHKVDSRYKHRTSYWCVSHITDYLANISDYRYHGEAHARVWNTAFNTYLEQQGIV